MSKWHRSEERFCKDVIIAGFHPEYQDYNLLAALQDLRQNRGEYV